MPFSFERGLCYRQYNAAVTSLGFVWNALLFLSFSFAVLRLFVRIRGGRGILVTCADTR